MRAEAQTQTHRHTDTQALAQPWTRRARLTQWLSKCHMTHGAEGSALCVERQSSVSTPKGKKQNSLDSFAVSHVIQSLTQLFSQSADILGLSN